MSIRLAVVGVGNCASSLLQSIEAAQRGQLNSGLSHPNLGGYVVEDIELVAAFDVDERKVGKDISDAALGSGNITTKYIDVAPKNIKVHCGPLLDGISSHVSSEIHAVAEAAETTVEDVTFLLKSSKANVVINFLPVGSQKASEAYAYAAIAANCSFVNCTPAVIANNPKISEAFARAGLPLLGDDIKSQIGSTAIHQVLISLLADRGLTLTKTYQLNIGGNADFRNMREPSRGIHKKKTKESSLTSIMTDDVELSVGPSDFVPLLRDNKVGYMHLEGVGILGMPFSIDLQLRVEDSPNSAGISLNAIRVAKIALDRKDKGVILPVCPAFFKAPPQQSITDTADFVDYIAERKSAA
jgi:myo-inositol-1-phosphate synthase